MCLFVQCSPDSGEIALAVLKRSERCFRREPDPEFPKSLVPLRRERFLVEGRWTQPVPLSNSGTAGAIMGCG